MPRAPVFEQGYKDGLARADFKPYGYPDSYRNGYVKGLLERDPWRAKLVKLANRLKRFAYSYGTNYRGQW